MRHFRPRRAAEETAFRRDSKRFKVLLVIVANEEMDF
jgi:hypothetical protein